MLRALLAATALSLAIPAVAETLPIAGSDPASANVNDLLRIAVERFEGADGAAVAQHLEAALGEARFDGHSYFRIVAPESGAPVDGLLTGTTRASVDEVPVIEKHKKCTEYDPADTKKCVKEVEVDIRCRRRTITVATTARLVAIKDGSIRYTRPLSARGAQASEMSNCTPAAIRRSISRSPMALAGVITPPLPGSSSSARQRAASPMSLAVPL